MFSDFFNTFLGEFMIEKIISRNNPLVTEVNKLKDKKERAKTNMFIFEGKKLFIEAVSSGVELIYVFSTEKNLTFCRDNLKGSFCKLYEVSESVYEKLTEEKSPDGIICVGKTIDKLHDFATIYINTQASGRRLILSSLRDPGNLGTVIRTCAAFSIDELIISSDCADIYNMKTIRASMGAVFKTKITIVENLRDSIISLKQNGFKVYATNLDKNSKNLLELDIDKKSVFVIGNEGHGLSGEIISACSDSVIIPMSGRTESLNASVAAGILIWEIFKRT